MGYTVRWSLGSSRLVVRYPHSADTGCTHRALTGYTRGAGSSCKVGELRGIAWSVRHLMGYTVRWSLGSSRLVVRYTHSADTGCTHRALTGYTRGAGSSCKVRGLRGVAWSVRHLIGYTRRWSLGSSR